MGQYGNSRFQLKGRFVECLGVLSLEKNPKVFGFLFHATQEPACAGETTFNGASYIAVTVNCRLVEGGRED
jgi:hypothetical protein